MTTLRILAIDNTSNHIFARATKSTLDYEKLKDMFKPEGEDDIYLPWYFLQLKDGVDIDGYVNFCEKAESMGWYVDRCIGRSVDGGYGAVIEAMSICVKVTDLIGEWFGRTDNQGKYYDIELVLCVNHLSYYKLIKEIKLKYSDVKIKLVCNVNTCDEMLVSAADSVVNVKEIDIKLEKANSGQF
jgi:hypothetical protein